MVPVLIAHVGSTWPESELVGVVWYGTDRYR